MDKTYNRRVTRSTLRSDRIRRVAYAAVSAVASIVIAWRVGSWFIGSPTDAAVILGCIAVWVVVRLDVVLRERGRM